MKQESIEIVISFQNPDLLDQPTQTYELEANQITLNRILEMANQFISKHINSNKFLEIYLRTKKGYENLYEIFEGAGESIIELERLQDRFALFIKIRETDDSEPDCSETLNKWEGQVQEMQNRVQKIRQDIQKQELRLGDENLKLIDLAFFYSEPLVDDGGKQIRIRAVSFEQEEARFTRTLRKANKVRDIIMQINVGTEENIREAISMGIKVLHFSCHGERGTGRMSLERSDRIGMERNVNFEELFSMIENDKPELIVFNVCFSAVFAKAIHERHPQIITIGYQRQTKDIECEIFAEHFYPDLFSGKSVHDAYDNVCKHLKEPENIQIYLRKDNHVKDLNIAKNFEPRLETIGHVEPLETQLFAVRLQLHEFIEDYMLGYNERLIIVKGEKQAGKTSFVKKSLLYLKQRKKIGEFFLIDLREVDSIVDLKCLYESKCEHEINRLAQRNEKVTLIFDHCDSLLLNDRREMISFVNGLNGRLCISKIIVIVLPENASDMKGVVFTKKQFILGKSDFTEYISYKANIPPNVRKNVISEAYNHISLKKIYGIELHEKALSKVKEDINGCYANEEELTKKIRKYWLYLEEETDRKGTKEKHERQQIQEKIQVAKNRIKSITEQCLEMVERMLSKLKEDYILFTPIVSLFKVRQEHFGMPFASPRMHKRESLAEDTLEEKLKSVQIDLIFVFACLVEERNPVDLLESLQSFVAYKLVYMFKEKSTEALNWNHMILLIRKCIGMVLKLKRISASRFEKRCIQTQMKFILVLYCLHANPCFELQSQGQLVIFRKIIESKSFTYRFDLPSVSTLMSIYETMLAIRPHVPDIEETSEIFGVNQINAYIKKCKKILSQHTQLYGQKETEFMMIPMIKLLEGHLRIHGSKLTLQSTEQFIEFLQRLNFLFEVKRESCYESIYSKYIENYVSILFTLEKTKLQKITEEKRIRRKTEIELFNKLIRICEDRHLSHLKNLIQRYKEESFNSCVALTSFPLGFLDPSFAKVRNDFRVRTNDSKKTLVLINPYRFENALHQMLVDTFKRIAKGVFIRLDYFNNQRIHNIREDKLPILISLFIVDCSNDENKSDHSVLLYLENEKGLSEPIPLSSIDLFRSSINIFCGSNVHKIKAEVERKGDSEGGDTTAFIFIDSVLHDQDKKVETYMQLEDKVAMFRHILHKKLLYGVLSSFYLAFCEVMFNEEHNNFGDQVSKAFNVAKMTAMTSVDFKIGHYFSDQIFRIAEKMDKYIPPLALATPPLKISELNNNLINEERGQVEPECGLNEQIITLLEKITEEAEEFETKYIIINAREEQFRQIQRCIEAKTKKMGFRSKLGKLIKEPFRSNLGYGSQAGVSSNEADNTIVFQTLFKEQIITQIQSDQIQARNRILIFFTEDSIDQLLEISQYNVQVLRIWEQDTFNTLVKVYHYAFERILTKIEANELKPENIEKEFKKFDMNFRDKKSKIFHDLDKTYRI